MVWNRSKSPGVVSCKWSTGLVFGSRVGTTEEMEGGEGEDSDGKEVDFVEYFHVSRERGDGDRSPSSSIRDRCRRTFQRNGTKKKTEGG